jgi:steroid delta-isomerase-like uncharacterized protein
MSEKNKEISRRLVECFDHGQLAGMRELCAPGVVATFNAGPEMTRDAFLEMCQAFERAFSQSKHTPLVQIAEGDHVTTRFQWRAVHSGDFNGLPATGKAVAIEIVQIDRIVDGKVVEHRGYADMMALMQQLGVAR